MRHLFARVTQALTNILKSALLISATSLAAFTIRRCPRSPLPTLKITPVICEFLSFEEVVRSNEDLRTRFPDPLLVFLMEEIDISSLIQENTEIVLEIDGFSDQSDIDDQIPEHSSGSYFLGEIEFLEEIEKKIKSQKDLFLKTYTEYLNIGRVFVETKQHLVEVRSEINRLDEISPLAARKLLLYNILNYYLRRIDTQSFLSWVTCLPEFSRIKQNQKNLNKKLELLDNKLKILFSNIRRFSPNQIRSILSRIQESQQKLLFQKEVEDSSFERLHGNSITNLTYKMARIVVTQMSGNEFVRRIIEVLTEEARARWRLKNESLHRLIYESNNLRLKARCFQQVSIRTSSFSTMCSSTVPSLTAGGKRIRTNTRMSRLRFEAGEISWHPDNAEFEPLQLQTGKKPFENPIFFLTETSENETSEEGGNSEDTAEQ